MKDKYKSIVFNKIYETDSNALPTKESPWLRKDKLLRPLRDHILSQSANFDRGVKLNEEVEPLPHVLPIKKRKSTIKSPFWI